LTVSHFARVLGVSHMEVESILKKRGYIGVHKNSFIPQFRMKSLWQEVSRNRFSSDLQLWTIALDLPHPSMTKGFFDNIFENRFSQKLTKRKNCGDLFLEINESARALPMTLSPCQAWLSDVSFKHQICGLFELGALARINSTGRQLIRALQSTVKLFLENCNEISFQGLHPKLFHIYPDEEDSRLTKLLVFPFAIQYVL